MYTCGPTVYNYPHIGNYRAYILADTLKRVLLYEGFKVKHIMNLTDVDDKTIFNSQKEGKTLKEFTEFYTKEFLKDIKSLNILNPNKFTKATDYINEMANIIKKLMKKGLAYKSADNSIYYDIGKFKNYGKLSRLVLERQKENASGRIRTDEYNKDNAQDFALWKAWDEKDGNVFWENKLGKGRPGWHIECSAMSMKNLGEQIDIHTGGVDLIFPHHENEIAQSEAASGSEFVKLWLHCKFLLVNGEKMSKSKGNFYTLRDLLAQGHDPMAVRYALLAVHYRTPLNFTMDSLKEAAEVIKRLDECYSQCLSYASRPMDYKDKEEASPAVNLRTDLDKHLQAMEAWLDDDLNISAALAQLMDIVSLINAVFLQQKKNNPHNVREAVNFFKKVDQLLGLDISAVNEIDGEIVELVDERRAARARKDFAESDRIKAVLDEKGWLVKDGKPGEPSTVKKKRRTWDFKKP